MLITGIVNELLFIINVFIRYLMGLPIKMHEMHPRYIGTQFVYTFLWDATRELLGIYGELIKAR